MSEENSFIELMEKLQTGDQEAAAEVFDRYAHRLIGLARTQLDAKVRQKVDPEDIMQSALRSFFVQQSKGRYDLSGWDNLWSLLVVITLRKCGHKVEYFRAACRDVQREALPQPTISDESAPSWQAVADDPTPLAASILADTLEQIMGRLNDDRERSIFELSLQGYTIVEISEKVGRSERTVQRIMKRIRGWLQTMRDE